LIPSGVCPKTVGRRQDRKKENVKNVT